MVFSDSYNGANEFGGQESMIYRKARDTAILQVLATSRTEMEI